MPAWKGIVGLACTPDEFDAYVAGLEWKSWVPQFITLHNTASPKLTDRPNGFQPNNINGLVSWYRDSQGWSAGPHLFIDDKKIHVFTDLRTTGVHSPSWNSIALGIEMLGDYSYESFTSGRGLQVRYNTTRAMAALSKKLGFPSDSWKFHVQDTRSTHDCPGKLARNCRAELVAEIAAHMKSPGGGGGSGPKDWDRVLD